MSANQRLKDISIFGQEYLLRTSFDREEDVVKMYHTICNYMTGRAIVDIQGSTYTEPTQECLENTIKDYMVSDAALGDIGQKDASEFLLEASLSLVDRLDAKVKDLEEQHKDDVRIMTELVKVIGSLREIIVKWEAYGEKLIGTFGGSPDEPNTTAATDV